MGDVDYDKKQKHILLVGLFIFALRAFFLRGISVSKEVLTNFP
jgi:hypothetical protein